MSRLSEFIVVVTGILAAWSAECVPTPQPVEIACEDAVLARAQQLFALAQFGHDNRERGAFVVRDSGGDYSFEVWPFNAEYRRAVFRGAMPAGTVAIIHTHPNAREYPSTRDQVLSERLGVPVYVVTRSRLSKADGFHVESVWAGDWRRRRGSRSSTGICGSGSLQPASGEVEGAGR